ncbi:sulfotransferase [Microbulbifer sp. YPW1]|uniref:sulfotransferase family protein n=1 Tax=Microbulbifer sp. YPW1 TaxID=2745199 RepID=UPI001599A0E1|nr:sulfotransferase [Microbulbifer sp. YPW1]QKX16593.1 sulfotransferase [Microbulbifer sp. YPW1]
MDSGADGEIREMSQFTMGQHEDPVTSPVFVVGPLRSGSTLLRLLLDHHPEIRIFGEFEGAVSQANGNQWPLLSDYKRFIATDRQTLALGLEFKAELDYVELIRDFLNQIHRRNPRRVIGATVHSRIDLLPAIWPDARFISLNRDPRDVANSCIGMGWAGNTYEGAYFWEKVEQHRTILRSRVKAEQILEVSYEKLVSSPSEVLKDICAFLGVNFDPAMVQIEKDTSYSFPSEKYANRWRTKMSSRDVRWVELRLGSLIPRAGFEVTSYSHQPLSPWEKFYIPLQNRIYKTHFKIRKWGFFLWLEQLVARKLNATRWEGKTILKTNAIDAEALK